ncbi:hypothetical protein [Vibrio coralliirubri]|uniref:hypothetical protein n=1 Tax=Vibrio coralliirubri TaxID=1516159 RepID=UPI0006309C56|nr:hypothetical protein [Vibrio coralliirubri]CDT44854.1 membrane hypothetical protein [Vibrio coralliirubri]
MKEILNDFVKGSSTEKLSIISNLSTILGVSVATFVAGPFLSEFANKEFIVSDFIIAIIFYFLCIWLVLAVIYSNIKEMYTFLQEKKYSKCVGDGVLLLLVTWFFVVSFPYAKHVVGNAFNVSYLLATPAAKAIKGIENVSIEKNEDILIVSGLVNFESQTFEEGYELLIYSRDDQATYSPVRFTSNEYTFELGSSGKFVVPINTKFKTLKNLHLVVVRSSDWSLLDKMGAGSGFPDSMTYLPDSSLEKLKAYIHKVET